MSVIAWALIPVFAALAVGAPGCSSPSFKSRRRRAARPILERQIVIACGFTRRALTVAIVAAVIFTACASNRQPGIEPLLAAPPPPLAEVEIDAFRGVAFEPLMLGFPGPPCPGVSSSPLLDQPYQAKITAGGSTRTNPLPADTPFLIAARPPKGGSPERQPPDVPFYGRLRGYLGDPAYTQCSDADRIFVVTEVVDVYREAPPLYYFPFFGSDTPAWSTVPIATLDVPVPNQWLWRALPAPRGVMLRGGGHHRGTVAVSLVADSELHARELQPSPCPGSDAVSERPIACWGEGRLGAYRAVRRDTDYLLVELRTPLGLDFDSQALFIFDAVHTSLEQQAHTQRWEDRRRVPSPDGKLDRRAPLGGIAEGHATDPDRPVGEPRRPEGRATEPLKSRDN